MPFSAGHCSLIRYFEHSTQSGIGHFIMAAVGLCSFSHSPPAGSVAVCLTAGMVELSGLVDSEGENWDDAENEGYLANELLGMYEADKNAYTAPRDYQGKIVPCGEKRYRVFMIDLAQCTLRREDESDMDWGRAKWTQDEEGAVGFVMKRRLGKLGFELVFNHSQRYLEFAERE